MEIYNYNLSKELLANNEDVILLTSSANVFEKQSNVIRVSDGLFYLKRWGLAYLSIFLHCIVSPKIKIRQWKTVMVPYTSNFGLNAWPIILFSKLF